jgi:hypothetical protein
VLPRPRISLLTSLLLMTCLGLAFTVWHMGREVVPLRSTIRALRQELGQFEVVDKDLDLIHAQRAKSITASAWKWRVHLPPGKEYSLCVTEGEMPDLPPQELAKWLMKHIEEQTEVGSLMHGQFTLEMAIERYGNRWWMSHVTHNKFHNLVRLISENDWYTQLQGEESYSDAPYERVGKFSGDAPVILFHVRRGEKVQVDDAWVTEPVSGEAQTMVIWIWPKDANQSTMPHVSATRRISQE